MKSQRTFNKLTPAEQSAMRPMLTHCPVRKLSPRKKSTALLVAAHQRAVRTGMQDCVCRGQA